jgi:hypothetical protein
MEYLLLLQGNNVYAKASLYCFCTYSSCLVSCVLSFCRCHSLFLQSKHFPQHPVLKHTLKLCRIFQALAISSVSKSTSRSILPAFSLTTCISSILVELWCELRCSRSFRELTDGAGLLYQTNAQYECYIPQPFLYLPSFACPCVGLISILLLPHTATSRGTKGVSLLCALCGLKPLYFIPSGFMYDVGVRGEVCSSIYTYKHIQ